MTIAIVGASILAFFISRVARSTSSESTASKKSSTRPMRDAAPKILAALLLLFVFDGLLVWLWFEAVPGLPAIFAIGGLHLVFFAGE